MNLNKKSLIFLIGAAALAAGILYIAAAIIINTGMSDLERQTVAKDTSQAVDAISNELKIMGASLQTISSSDGAYAYASGQNPGYADTQFNDSALRNRQWNLVLVVDPQNQVVYQKGYDLGASAGADVPSDFLQSLTPNSPLLTEPVSTPFFTGVANSAKAPILVAAASILNSAGEGPSRGIIIVGRYLTADVITALGQSIQMPVALASKNDTSQPDFLAARNSLNVSNPYYVRPVDNQTVAGYTWLSDINGELSWLLRVEAPRAVYAQGIATQRIYLFAVILLCLGYVVVAYIALHQILLRPLQHITQGIETIISKGDLTARLAVEKNDEFAKLSMTINKMLNELEQRVQYQRRLGQIRIASEISRAISGVLDQKELIQEVVDLVAERLELYYAGVFLIDDTGENALLKAGTGEAGKRMIEAGHKLPVRGASMIGRAIHQHRSQIALDVGKEAIRFNNPYLPLTRSEMAIPILSGDEALGAITIQSSKERAFDENDIAVLQGVADSLAIALKNAQLFHQVEANLEEIRSLHRQYLTKSWMEISSQAQEMSYTYEGEAPEAAQVEPDPAAKALDFPILLRQQVIGHVQLDLDRPDLTPAESALVETVLNETALALENIRLVEEVQRRGQEQQLVSDISAKTQGLLDLESVMKTAVREIGSAIHATKVQLRLRNEPAPVVTSGNGGSPNLN